MSTNEGLRAPARTGSPDPRAARVRDRLRRAAFELIEQRRVEKISVSDITQRAGVSRQVFYQHFRDRDDAVASAVAASLQAAAAETDGEHPVALIHRLCDYTAEHAGLYRNLYPSAASQQTADAYRDLIRPACERLAAGLSERSAGVLADFLIGGIIEVSRHQDENADAGTAARANALRARIDACLDAVGIQVS
ncbi:TetR/AcrR family transcriptional regulator [Amycolatopsis sp. NPDC021455]|uniref:TetR/AcrR family transcriptional regulator n=1 Tax=Amycolatopsis sp. NPDC021455 TaxID=3154901 RepID=UPI0033FD5EFF